LLLISHQSFWFFFSVRDENAENFGFHYQLLKEAVTLAF